MKTQLEVDSSSATIPTQAKTLPTAEELRELLDYNPETGWLTWRVDRGGKARAGSRAGNLNPNGYRFITVNYVNYTEHRLVWCWVTGRWPGSGKVVMHGNGESANNSWSNLSLGTQVENLRDQKISSTNTSGFMGVTWHKPRQKWVAQIVTGGSAINLGGFDNIDDAAGIRITAEMHFGFHPDHGTRS